MTLDGDSAADGFGRLQQHHTRHTFPAGLLSKAAQSRRRAVQHAKSHGRRHQSVTRRSVTGVPGTSIVFVFDGILTFLIAFSA